MKQSAILSISRDESGQAVTEYILMVAVVLGFYMIVANFLGNYGLGAKLSKPITTSFARTYQYGKSDVKGFEDGGPYHHPRILKPENFRIFINPTPQ
jgi:hypothetical protein